MYNNKKEIIPIDSPEAAKEITITGWVSSNGRFYHKDEKLARWDGCTHTHCDTCGKLGPKMYTICEECREKKQKDRYNAREKKVWDGKTMLYSDAYSEYFMDVEDIDNFLDGSDSGATIEDLQLLICEPQYATEVNPYSFYEDLAPDDVDDFLPKEIIDAFKELNIKIKKCKTPISWFPGKCAAILEKEE
jgi:hypothetical protein